MHDFDYIETPQKLVNAQVGRLLTRIYELKGRVSEQLKAAPAIQESLLKVARVQSTDASNRLEGIVTTDSRLKALMQQKTTPRNRSEEEIAGYRDVLATVHESHAYIAPTPNNILQLHRDLYSYAGNGGSWKMSDNRIIETMPNGEQRIRFSPVSAIGTPDAMERLCTAYQKASASPSAEPLILIGMFILDFLCIHPFHDGNGRMSRLLTLLLLYRGGFDVGRFISLEKLMESAKEGYYDALQRASESWHENANDYTPFLRYFLGILIKAYTELEERLKGTGSHTSGKSDRIRLLFETSLNPLRKSDIAERCPDISLTTIERTLKAMLDTGLISRIGKGRSSAYVRKG